MNMAICTAIRNRAVVQFYYDGGTRTVEPHCHGISTTGNEVLRAYQTAGYSESGKSVGWKILEVAKITSFRQADVTFSTNRPGYNPNDSGMSSVHCHV